MPVALRSPSAPLQISPGMTHPPSRLCPSDIRCNVPYKFRALTILAVLPRCNASYPLPVRQASALPSASSRFAVARDTLAVRLTLPLAGRVEDFHLQVSAPCRAHQIKTPRTFRHGAFYLRSLAVTYFHMGNPHYHRRGLVSLLSSGWDQVVPTCSSRQAEACCLLPFLAWLVVS